MRRIISICLILIILVSVNTYSAFAATNVTETSVKQIFELGYTHFTSWTGQFEYTSDVIKRLAILLDDGRLYVSEDVNNPDLQKAILVDTEVEEMYDNSGLDRYLFYSKNNNDLYAMSTSDHNENEYEYQNIRTFGSDVKPDAFKGIKIANDIHEVVHYNSYGVLYVINQDFQFTTLYNDKFAFLVNDGWSIKKSDYEVNISNVVKARYDSSTGFALKSNGELWAWGYGRYNEFMNDKYDGVFSKNSKTGFERIRISTKVAPFLYTIGVVDFDYYDGQLMVKNYSDSFYVSGRSFSHYYGIYTDQDARDTYYSVKDSYPSYYHFLAAIYNRIERVENGYNGPDSYDSDFFVGNSERIIQSGFDNRGIISDYKKIIGAYVISDMGVLYDFVGVGHAPIKVAQDVVWVSTSPIGQFNSAYDETGFKRSGNTYYVKENGDVYQINNETNSHRLIMNSKVSSEVLTDSRDLLFLFASNWAIEELVIARSLGLTKPVDFENFREYITREQFCEIAIILYEELMNEVLPLSQQKPFNDTTNPSVIKAYELGIVNGVGNGRFAPDEKITREQLAVMLNNVFKKSDFNNNTQTISMSFVDENEFASWSKDAIIQLAQLGVIKGVSSNTFAPKDNVSIEQAVLLAKRLLELH